MLDSQSPPERFLVWLKEGFILVHLPIDFLRSLSLPTNIARRSTFIKCSDFLSISSPIPLLFPFNFPGADPEETILNAFKVFDPDSKGLKAN